MRLRGAIINSIFKFIEDVTFTEGDILYYNYNFYIVKKDYIGSDTYTPDVACIGSEANNYDPPLISYISYHEYNEENQSETSIITARAFFTILNSYFKGLAGNGELQKLIIETKTDKTATELLNELTDVGAYWCEVRENLTYPSLVIPEGKYLLRIYPCGLERVQELVDYINGVIFFRYVNYEDGHINEHWSAIPNGYETIYTSQRADNYYVKLNSHINQMAQKLRTIMEYDRTLWRKSFDFIHWEFTKTASPQFDTYTLLDVPVNRIINLIIINEESDEVQQFSKEFYLIDSKTSYEYLAGSDIVKVTQVNDTVSIVMPNRYKLVKVYLSKDKT